MIRGFVANGSLRRGGLVGGLALGWVAGAGWHWGGCRSGAWGRVDLVVIIK